MPPAVFVIWAAGLLTVVAGWITHIFWIFKLASSAAVTGGQVALMILGVLAPPIGALHGFWLWFH